MIQQDKLIKKAILFDMDGTLVGLKPSGRLATLQKTLSHFDITGIEQEQADRFWFTAERYTMIADWGIPTARFWEILDSEELLQLQLQHTVCFRDAGVVRILARQDLRLGVVSNSAHVSLQSKLKLLSKHLNPRSFHHITSCSEDAPRPKPCPSGIELTLQRLGVEAHEALLVGDSMDDVRAANAAGVDVAIIDRGEPIKFDTAYSFHRINTLWKLRDLVIAPRLSPAMLGFQTNLSEVAA